MSVLGSGVSGILDAMAHLGGTLATTLEARAQRLRAGIRHEVRRAASTLALAIAAAALGVAALLFGAVAILIAAWDTHPVLAAALIALGFGMLAIVAVLVLRSNSR